MDFQLYNNNASLFVLEEGQTFGLRPEEYPLDW
jgi:hypothetical protein